MRKGVDITKTSDISYPPCQYTVLRSGCSFSAVSGALLERRRKQLEYIYKFMVSQFKPVFSYFQMEGASLQLADRNGVIAFGNDPSQIGKVARSTEYTGPEMLNLLHKSNYIYVTAFEVGTGRESEEFCGMWYILRDLTGEPFAIIMNRYHLPCTEQFIQAFYICCQAVQSHADHHMCQQAIIDAMPSPVFVTGMNGKVKQMNATARGLTGDIVGRVFGAHGGQDQCDIPGYSLVSDTLLDHIGHNGTASERILVLASDKPTAPAMPAGGSAARPQADEIVGHSPAIMAIKQTIGHIARKPVSVLIQGESGTGKELIAKAVHIASGRKGRFVPINCGAIDRNLLYSELFGYEDGSFTGATRGGKKGKIEYANGGTLFLDEIGEMPLDMQVSLLRVLEEKAVMPVGGKTEHGVDIRVIAATNRDLKREVDKGTFRADLYFRLAVIPIYIPPLRDRQEDIRDLTQMYVRRICMDYGLETATITEEFYAALCRCPWYGNVRELRNTLEYVLLMSDGNPISAQALSDVINNQAFYGSKNAGTSSADSGGKKRQELLDALERCNNNKSKAAELLGISRKTLYVRMAQYGLEGK